MKSGDFNCRTDNDQDKSTCIRQLKKIINKLDLLDAWKLKYPDLKGLTWCKARYIPTSRINFDF